MGRRLCKIRDQSDDEPSVNLTPLIDVVFCILIMFIVIAPLLELDRIQLADANSSKQEGSISVADNGPISLHVQQDNTITLNRQAIALPQLAEALKQEKQKHPEVRPQVYHDKRATFGTYQSVKNAAEEAGFHEMDIILQP